MDLFANAYDPFMSAFELAGLRRWRAELLADLSGAVLELGAGTGANLPHYGPDVDRLVLLEPARGMRDVLEQRARSRAGTEVVAEPGESLPFEDASFDAVVFGLVLCSVDDPDQVVREARRVLKPTGEAVFIEHVVGHGPLAWLHHAATPLWSRMAGGCQLNRDTRTTFEQAGFTFTSFERRSFPLAFGLVPVIRGVARPS